MAMKGVYESMMVYERNEHLEKLKALCDLVEFVCCGTKETLPKAKCKQLDGALAEGWDPKIHFHPMCRAYNKERLTYAAPSSVHDELSVINQAMNWAKNHSFTGRPLDHHFVRKEVATEG